SPGRRLQPRPQGTRRLRGAASPGGGHPRTLGHGRRPARGHRGLACRRPHRGLRTAGPRSRGRRIPLRSRAGVRCRPPGRLGRPTSLTGRHMSNKGSAATPGRNVVVDGTQWGDEGKGKLVDWLTESAQGVVRVQAGHNAGHPLVINGVRPALHLLPSAIMRAGVKCYSGNGVVLSVGKLFEESVGLEKAGVEVRSRRRVSEGCPLILPFHAAIDIAREAAKVKAGAEKIGTT